MAGTYASMLAVLAVSAAVGQAVFAASGRRDWSWLSPAVGLAVCCAVAWAAVRLPGEGTAAAVALGLLLLGSLAVLAPGRRELAAALRPGVPIALAAAALASLPFLLEMRFGILGTSLNPDMSQHLFAADRLVSGGEERLISQGYPLGPHALVVALSALGPSLVHGFGGLTLAVAVAASLAPLALLGDLAPGKRAAAALLVGLAYMASSYLVQGAFKETMQALFVLAFAIGLQQLAGDRLGGRTHEGRWRLLGGVPLAVIAAGSVYAYSFPGLAWLLGAFGIWALWEIILARRSPARGLAHLLIGTRNVRRRAVRALAPPAAVALGVLLVATAPELGRIADFADFETFDPEGAGLGNLYNPISPLEALGIWPSGDFRLDPGAGFAPAVAFWAGGALALAALGFGLRWWLRRGERAVPAALAAATLLYLYALVAGTPYQEAKAVAIAAPLAMLIAVRALLAEAPSLAALRSGDRNGLAVAGLALSFCGAAAACSVLALANGPVGPSQWSPALTEFRGQLGQGSVLVVATDQLMDDQRGADLIAWELRGHRVCIERESDLAGAAAALAYDQAITIGPLEEGPDVAGTLDEVARAGDLALFRVSSPGADADCPLYEVGGRADPTP